MPTPQQTINDARFETSVDSTQYTDANAIIAYNKIMHDLENTICMYLKDEWFYKETDKTIDIVAWQKSYSFPSWSSTIHDSLPQMKNLLRVEIKYMTESRYQKATPFTYDWTWRILEDEKTLNSAITPKFLLTEDGFDIYPTPIENVTDWIIIDYQRSDIDVVIWATETSISIPWQFHEVIQQWVESKIHKARRKYDEARISRELYKEMKWDMIQKLSEKYLQPVLVNEFYPRDLM